MEGKEKNRNPPEFSVYEISPNLKIILLFFFILRVLLARQSVLPRGAFSRDVCANPSLFLSLSLF